MALYHFSAQIIGRKEGRSAVRSAAYRHSAKMVSEYTGETISYSGKQPVAHKEIALPDNTPVWLRTLVDGRTQTQASEAFWNAVELYEKRSDAQLAREINIALPLELTREQSIAMVQEFVREQYTSRGMVVDWVMHDKQGNPHIHLMHTLRPLSEEGFGGKKVARLDDAGNPLRDAKGKILYELWSGGFVEQLNNERAAWAEKQNYHLAMHGHEARVDSRSYADQGIGLVPTSHLGIHANGMKERTGFVLDRRKVYEEERSINAERFFDNPSLIHNLITRDKSVFTERDVAKTLFRYIDEPVDFAKLQLRLGLSPDLVAISPEVHDPETNRVIMPARFTTRQVLETEHRMVETAFTLAQREGYLTYSLNVATAFTERSFLSDEQQAAVKHVTAENHISVVVGYAGAGKSTMLDAARIAWERQGFTVYGAALAGKAAEGLQESAGIESRTLAAWELRWNSGIDALKAGDVFVLDEAGLVSASQMARIVSRIDEAGAKLVLVGDWQQLQAIEAGSPFRAIAERVGYVELTGIRRQRHDWQREASVQFARGEVVDALQSYDDKGHIVITGTGVEAKAALIENWHKSDTPLAEKLIMASTNADMRDLNTLARDALKADGQIGQEAQFSTERGARSFGQHDRVLFLQNAKIYQNSEEAVAVKNGMLGTVVEAGDNTLVVRLDRGDTLRVSADQYNSLDHGYAVTVHKAQGVTVDRAWLYASSMMDAHSTYVGMTRHRDTVMMFAGADGFSVKGFGELVKHGAAPYEHNPQNKQSYYVTLADSSGKERTIWGVDLERALGESKAAIGDKIGLEHLGAQTVTLPDGRTAQRNTWQVNTTADIEPDKLFESLGRNRLKESTTDYAAGEDYRAALAAFAERRGIDTPHLGKVFLAKVTDRIESITQSMRQRFENVAAKFDRLAKAIRPEQATTTCPAPERLYPPLFKAVTEFDQKLESAARENALQDRHVMRANTELQELAARVYKDPHTALQKIALQAQTGKDSYHAFHRDHTHFGELRGADSLLKGLKARQERKHAEAGMVSLANGIKAYEKAYTAAYDRELKAEHDRREAMKVEVPSISPQAHKALEEISQIDKLDADKHMASIAALYDKQPKIADEVERLAKALDRRFGDRALSSSLSKDLTNRIAQSEKQKFETYRVTLRTAQIVKNTQQVLVERERQAKLTPSQSQNVERGIRM